MDMDLEARVTQHSSQAMRLWLRWQTCTQLLQGPIRIGLREQFHTTQPRFALLAQLGSAPEGLTMKELSRRMMVSGGNVTGVTDHLVASGWAQRITDRTDRRSYRVCLTSQGQRHLRRMAAQHDAWIDAMFAHLSARERAVLFTLLGKIKTGLRPPLKS